MDGQVRPFINTPVNEYAAAPSPDGRFVAYVSELSGTAQVLVRSIRDSSQIQISNAGGTEPLWSHDGRQVFYRQPQTSELFVVDVQGTPALQASPGRRVLKLPPWVGAASRDPTYAIAPDGRILVIRPNHENATTTALRVLVQPR